MEIDFWPEIQWLVCSEEFNDIVDHKYDSEVILLSSLPLLHFPCPASPLQSVRTAADHSHDKEITIYISFRARWDIGIFITQGFRNYEKKECSQKFLPSLQIPKDRDSKFATIRYFLIRRHSGHDNPAQTFVFTILEDFLQKLDEVHKKQIN